MKNNFNKYLQVTYTYENKDVRFYGYIMDGEHYIRIYAKHISDNPFIINLSNLSIDATIDFLKSNFPNTSDYRFYYIQDEDQSLEFFEFIETVLGMKTKNTDVYHLFYVIRLLNIDCENNFKRFNKWMEKHNS